MGDRDHSIKCETCGLQRGGLNDYKCFCDKPPAFVPAAQQEIDPLNQAIDRMIAADQTSIADDLLAKVRSMCAEVSIGDLRAAIEAHRSNCHQLDGCPVLAAMEEGVLIHLAPKSERFEMKMCPVCRGSGQYCTTYPKHFSPCWECRGTGKVRTFAERYAELIQQPKVTKMEEGVTRKSLHQARLAPWTPADLMAHLCVIVDTLAADKARDISPLDVVLELLGGELEAFVLFGRMGHLDPPREDGKVPIAILQCNSADPEVDARIRECVQKWASEKEPQT